MNLPGQGETQTPLGISHNVLMNLEFIHYPDDI